jgi:hypothetical protein
LEWQLTGKSMRLRLRSSPAHRVSATSPAFAREGAATAISTRAPRENAVTGRLQCAATSRSARMKRAGKRRPMPSAASTFS